MPCKLHWMPILFGASLAWLRLCRWGQEAFQIIGGAIMYLISERTHTIEKRGHDQQSWQIGNKLIFRARQEPLRPLYGENHTDDETISLDRYRECQQQRQLRGRENDSDADYKHSFCNQPSRRPGRRTLDLLWY
ncbi:hypothetical protein DFH09DRAFT_1096886 [Mycena vulgaris]|nr:hypothetical protein DFH09DRAFT_1096886 [Mycena vulgaris]